MQIRPIQLWPQQALALLNLAICVDLTILLADALRITKWNREVTNCCAAFSRAYRVAAYQRDRARRV